MSLCIYHLRHYCSCTIGQGCMGDTPNLFPLSRAAWCLEARVLKLLQSYCLCTVVLGEWECTGGCD